MSIEQIFAGRTMDIAMQEDHEHHLKAVTVRIQETDVKVADFLATSLYTTRQDILSEIIHNGLKEALVGYCKASGFDEKKWLEIWQGFYINETGNPSKAIPSLEDEK